MGVADGVGQRQHQVPLHAPVRHFDESAFLRVAPHQVGLGVQALQVSADGAGFGEYAAVVQFQRGHACQRAFGQVGGLFVLLSIQADVDERQALDGLLDQEHLDPAGVGRAGRDIQLHGAEPFKLWPISTMRRASSANR
ncbi:hypothetical protein D9M69_582010 [compost metagenome]